MEAFESLLKKERCNIERFVRYYIDRQSDAEDVLQETYMAAFLSFAALQNKEAFKGWLLSIARNKIRDHYRKQSGALVLPLDTPEVGKAASNRYDLEERYLVQDVLAHLSPRDQQILYLYFWKDLSQKEIAECLAIPIGTVKSRLHTAKTNFKSEYSDPTQTKKGGTFMKRLPEHLPEYTITECPQPPFAVKWEELMGWFLVPKLGEKLSWAMYDIPSRQCTHVYDLCVTGKAKVHGIEGVELTAEEAPYSNKKETVHRTFVAQLTDTHCRYLATLRHDGDVHNYITFLDGEEFLLNWGFGEDNCGNETNLAPKGDICRCGSRITTADKEFLLDIVGRYTVTINGQNYDTVCVMDIETYNSGVVSEQFLDRNGKTVLWRRFNRNDWHFDRYQRLWSDQLPENERLEINGTTYVHWYDCITDYIL